MLAAWLLLACTPEPEPIDLPEDPSLRAAPVGVRTVQARGQHLEVFYPAAESERTTATENVSFAEFIPSSVIDKIGEVDLPDINAGAVRDGEPRLPDDPYPVVLFSHGFGGMRTQSLDYAAHLASRGYVVVAVDHPGRMANDLLPCVFDPPLDDCDLSGVGEDPAPEDLDDAIVWLQEQQGDESSFLFERLDLDTLGLSGHSAGGQTTATYGSEDTRFKALLVMGNLTTPTRAAPTLLMGGTCDVYLASSDAGALTATPEANLTAARAAITDGRVARFTAAGHLIFSDLCELELSTFIDDRLANREDVNATYIDMLRQLASDGCPGAAVDPLLAAEADCAEGFGDLRQAQLAARGLATVFFDVELKGEGDGLDAQSFEEVTVE